MVRDPFRDSVASQKVEFKYCCRVGEGGICFRACGSRHNQHQIGCRAFQVVVEGSSRILLESVHLTKHDNPALSHHGWSREQHSQCLGIKVRGPPCIQIEVPGSRVECGFDELP